MARKRGLSKRKKHSKLRLFVLLVIIALFTSSVVEIIYFFYSVKYVKVYDAFLRVERDKVGLNVDVETSKLNLGIVPPGGSVKREIVLVNNGTEPFMGSVVTKGKIAKFLLIEKEFILENDGPTRLSLIAKVPSDTRVGNYSGQIIIVLRKV